MSATDPDAGRLAEIESRLAFLDDTVEQLSGVIANQDREILDLRAQLRGLADKLRELADWAASGDSGAGHEPPPHY